MTTRTRMPLLRLAIEASGDTLPEFHDFVLSLVSRRMRPAHAQRVAAAASELLDNAMAYATMSRDIIVEIHVDVRNVSIEVSNDTVASRVRMLAERIEKLQESPQDIYVEEMRRSMNPAGPRPMMGLARVRHESKMDLTLTVEGDRVTVVAQGRS